MDADDITNYIVSTLAAVRGRSEDAVGSLERIDVKEAAFVLGFQNSQTIYNEVHARRLNPSLKIGKYVFFDSSELNRYLSFVRPIQRLTSQ